MESDKHVSMQAEEGSEEYAAGVLSQIAVLPRIADASTTPEMLKLSACKQIMRALRSDYVWLLAVERTLPEFLVATAVHRTERRHISSILEGIDPIQIVLPIGLKPDARTYCAIRPCSEVVNGVEKLPSSPGGAILYDSKALFVFPGSTESELIVVGWRDQIPTLHGLFHYVPAIVQLVIDGYIVSHDSRMGESSAIRSATANLIHEAKSKIRQWANVHSDPMTPLLFAHGRSWSPIEIAQEVEEDTDLGAELYTSLIRQGLSRGIRF